MAQVLSAGKGNVLVLVGTRKGAFVLSSDGSRRTWSVSRPHLEASDIFHLRQDPRNRGNV